MYTVILQRSVQKQLDRMPAGARADVLSALGELRDNPRPHGCAKIKGAADLWRIRIGAYRAIYTIQDDRLIVFVLRVAHRKDAYRDM